MDGDCAKGCKPSRHGHPFRSKNNFDRFIPYRPNLDIHTSHRKILSPLKTPRKEPGQYKDDKNMYYNELLAGAFDSEINRILPTVQRNDSGSNLRSPASPLHPPFFDSTMDKVFRSPRGRLQTRRYIPSPTCVMDMPCLRDDFYTNILDWGSTNKIAVSLQHLAFIWDAETKECVQVEVKNANTENFYVSSLSWNPAGNMVGIADNNGNVMMCDPTQVKITQQTSLKDRVPISVLRWSEMGIFCGNRNGNIVLLDPRTPNMTVAEFIGHRREVCGLQVAEGTTYMASGGDEGIVCIWDLKTTKHYKEIKAHTACSKALAWCPWRKSVIATGGGSSDGHIRLWHIHTGEKMAEMYTKSQICSLLWSEDYKELASSHGSLNIENNDIILWKMNQFEFSPVARLSQHIARPLHMSLSPNKTTLASAGADESLCLWNCFPVKRRNGRGGVDLSPLALGRCVR